MADPATTVAEDLESVPPESVKVIAQTVGIESLPDEVARALAPDVEYRLREVIQDACKFMRHSKRTELSTEDVNASLKLREVEPLYGFPAGAGPIPFREVPGHPELFIQENREIELKDVLAAKLPRPPIAVNVVPHWLAVEGVQPLIPENPPPLPEENLRPDVLRAADFRAPVAPGEVVGPGGAKRPREGAAPGAAAGAVAGAVAGADGTVIQPVVAHELSKELQVYYDRVTAVARGGGVGGEAPLLRAALDSLATDGGLHQLMPYFVQFVSEEVAKSLKNLPRLRAMVAMTRSLVVNPAVHVELYLHQLMPGIVTCMVAKRLGANPDEDHWSLRRAAAEVMALVCREFGDAYPTIQPRITRTLLRALLDASKPPSTHFGAVAGLSALGSRVTRLLLLPNLEAYLATLEPHLAEGEGAGAGANANAGATEEEKAAAAKATRRRADARRVHDALKEAVGKCLHDVLVAPRREARERDEPARRAQRQRANGDGAPTTRERPPPASAVAGWTVGKNGASVSVRIGKGTGAGAEDKAADAPAGSKKSPAKSPGRASKRGKAAEGAEGGEDGEKVELTAGAAGEDAGDDPAVVAAQVAAAAALLGDCVLPYASDAATADAFI